MPYVAQFAQKNLHGSNYIIQDSAQWVNKAKFHMLLHLPESILRYGPASLFATEKLKVITAFSEMRQSIQIVKALGKI
ncbi:hypothetical protein H4Q26_011011 [Puccinia striiformis f. sp. tritici PST-130]|nr:hypothetical protein H4Q26_011011 [Puccinia striiformis f. sp. tritici PST-130]